MTDRLFDVSDIVRLLEAAEKEAAQLLRRLHLIEGLVIAVIAGGFIAWVGFDDTGPWRFLKRWVLATILLIGMFWGGAAAGAVARNALCEGFWVCK